MHHTGYKKESKKEILKKENKKGYGKFASRGFEPGPSESVRTKSLRLKPLDHFVLLLYGDWQFSRMTLYFPCRIKSLTDRR